MKNPLSRQARCEPFCPIKRHTFKRWTGFGPPPRNAAPPSLAGVASPGHVACDFFATLLHRHESVTF